MVVCVNNVSSKRKDEIQDYEGKINPNMTLDKEVQKADAACEQAIRLSTEAVHWSRVPTCWRLGASHPTILDLLFASTLLRQGFLALAPYNLEAFLTPCRLPSPQIFSTHCQFALVLSRYLHCCLADNSLF